MFYKSLNRNATCRVVHNEDVHLCEMTISTYKEYILSERGKVRNKEISFLLDNFFFKGIKKNYFEKKYYSIVVQETYLYGKVLYNENDPADFIYFIREGQIELSFNYSMMELHRRLRSLVKFIPELRGLDYALLNGIFLQFYVFRPQRYDERSSYK